MTCDDWYSSRVLLVHTHYPPSLVFPLSVASEQDTIRLAPYELQDHHHQHTPTHQPYLTHQPHPTHSSTTSQASSHSSTIVVYSNIIQLNTLLQLSIAHSIHTLCIPKSITQCILKSRPPWILSRPLIPSAVGSRFYSVCSGIPSPFLTPPLTPFLTPFLNPLLTPLLTPPLTPLLTPLLTPSHIPQSLE